MALRSVAKQLAKPTGIAGKLIRFLMNRGNARLNRFAIDQLAVKSSDRVLEIGFGGGVTLQPLLSKAQFVQGIDPSADVIAVARNRFSTEIEKGTAHFQEGSAESLPLPSGTFDKVLTVNTVYFWSSLEDGLQEIRRVLTPGGRIVIGFTPQARMDRMNLPKDIFTSRTPNAIADALRNTRFAEVEIRDPWGQDEPMVATGVVE